MKYIQLHGTDASYNLAAEEYIFTNLAKEQDHLVLWQNRSAVIIGRHQNTIEEINQEYVKEKNIQVVRRLSGGGAVYHDLGNLNYTFIINTQDKLYDFKIFAQPVIQTLKKIGVNADFTGRNDLAVNGLKISGAAQMIKKKRLLHHGTMLFHSDLDMLTKVLKVKAKKIESKGIKSVRSRVSNICSFAPHATIENFKTTLKETLSESQSLDVYELTSQDHAAISSLAKEKYSTWDWNYGYSPEYDIKKDFRFTGGTLSIYTKVKKGTIQTIHFFGDYFGEGDIREVEQALESVQIKEDAVAAALSNTDISAYIHNLTNAELVNFIID